MIYDSEQANNIATRLKSQAETWLTIYTKLNRIILEMNNAFISQTQVAFSAANDRNQQNYSNMKALLEEMAEALVKSQSTMIEVDEVEASRIRSRFGID